MSNIVKAISFLEVNPEERFVTANNTLTGKLVGKEKIYLSDLPNKDLEAYIKFHLGIIDRPTTVWIELRKMAGSTHRLEHKFGIEVQPDRQPIFSNDSVQEVIPKNLPVMQEQPVYHSQYLGSPNANAMAVETAKVIDMHVKAERLEDGKERIAELKEELALERKEHRLLQIDYRKAITDLSTAEAQKVMAVMMAKAENKGFFDSDGFMKILEKAPDMLDKAIALKSGNVPEAAGALGTAGMSETKKQFVTLVSNSLQDNEVLYLGSICHYLDNQNFLNELSQLIQKYASNGS